MLKKRDLDWKVLWNRHVQLPYCRSPFISWFSNDRFPRFSSLFSPFFEALGLSFAIPLKTYTFASDSNAVLDSSRLAFPCFPWGKVLARTNQNDESPSGFDCMFDIRQPRLSRRIQRQLKPKQKYKTRANFTKLTRPLPHSPQPTLLFLNGPRWAFGDFSSCLRS